MSEEVEKLTECNRKLKICYSFYLQQAYPDVFIKHGIYFKKNKYSVTNLRVPHITVALKLKTEKTYLNTYQFLNFFSIIDTLHLQRIFDHR